MAYNRTIWQDHVVEHPRTYTEVTNGDNSKTFTPAPGEILQQGTPMSATNFNHMEVGIGDAAVSLDAVICVFGSQIRQLQDELSTIKEQLEAIVE